MAEEREQPVIQPPPTKGLFQITRRGFLQVAGLVAAAAAGAGILRQRTELPTIPVSTEVPVSSQYPEVPYAPASPPPADILSFFTPHEAKTVEALTARILPGTPDDPGAREAGVVNYIDKKMVFNEGFAEPTYRSAPFAQTYEGDKPPQNQDTYQVVWVKKDELERYGFQSIHSPREMYRKGLASVDQYAKKQFQKQFVDLSEDQQDQILEDMSNDKAEGFEDPSGKAFFTLLRNDTIDGMFSDPAYGGNRDMVGWKLIGYPGAQRAYTPTDMMTEGEPRPPQSLAMMHHFHPGQAANPDVILPVSGSEEHAHYDSP
jgi:hypothetical protein